MTLMIFFLMGGLLGLVSHYYCSQFERILKQDVYSAYLQLFLPNIIALPERMPLTPIDWGRKSSHFFLFALLFNLSLLFFQETKIALVFSLYVSLLINIARLDWHYQLIPVELCQLLALLGWLSADQQIIPISLSQSLYGFLVGFSIFWLLYHFSRYYYQQEVFGRGDYWLIAGLSTFLPLENLPLMVLLACIGALVFAFWQKLGGKNPKVLPFGPFLAIAGMLLFLHQ